MTRYTCTVAMAAACLIGLLCLMASVGETDAPDPSLAEFGWRLLLFVCSCVAFAAMGRLDRIREDLEPRR